MYIYIYINTDGKMKLVQFFLMVYQLDMGCLMLKFDLFVKFNCSCISNVLLYFFICYIFLFVYTHLFVHYYIISNIANTNNFYIII